MEWTVESFREDGTTLDLYSTSPTLYQDLCLSFPQSTPHCVNHAPYFAFQREGKRYGVVQGSCNQWSCPRCGILVAKGHYGRIVEGAREIARREDLWFITLTCRGADVTVSDAETNYLKWTSKFLDACYAKQKRAGKDWFYVQVTEKQRRGHPHSHILTNFHPADEVDGVKENWVTSANGKLTLEYEDTLRSFWIQCAVGNAGLGEQYDISKVKDIEGASRYVAKYMFKETQFLACYPKHWKRVRYSQSWPKFERKTSDAFILLSQADWTKLGALAAVIDVPHGSADEAYYMMKNNDVVIIERKEEAQK